MTTTRLLGAVLAAAATLGLGGCTMYDEYGYPSSTVSVGIGTGYGYGYGDPYYDDYYGWYDDYYYPGIGTYIYDRYGTRYTWPSRYRDYWSARSHRHRDRRAHWDGYCLLYTSPSPRD